jgi:nitroreductase
MTLAANTSESIDLRNARLHKRYRNDLARSDNGDWNPVLDTILTRRSVRSYLSTPVSPAQLEAIVAAAQSASTSSNLQAWSVVAIQDPARKARIAELADSQRHILQAPLLLAFISDLSRLRAIGSQRQLAVDGLDYFESFMISVGDATLAAQNAVVAANSLGLGTCFIGALRNKPEEMAAELGLPDEAFAIFGVLVGHPDPARQSDVKPRLPLPAVLHHERYQPIDPSLLDAYDKSMRIFQKEQNMQEVGWTRKSAARVSGPGSLSGRDRLVAALRARGFGLK